MFDQLQISTVQCQTSSICAILFKWYLNYKRNVNAKKTFKCREVETVQKCIILLEHWVLPSYFFYSYTVIHCFFIRCHRKYFQYGAVIEQDFDYVAENQLQISSTQCQTSSMILGCSAQYSLDDVYVTKDMHTQRRRISVERSNQYRNVHVPLN